MSTPAPTSPYTLGNLEAASVAFLGAFAGVAAPAALAGTSVSWAGAFLAGVIAFAAMLGYTGYQSS